MTMQLMLQYAREVLHTCLLNPRNGSFCVIPAEELWLSGVLLLPFVTWSKKHIWERQSLIV